MGDTFSIQRQLIEPADGLNFVAFKIVRPDAGSLMIGSRHVQTGRTLSQFGHAVDVVTVSDDEAEKFLLGACSEHLSQLAAFVAEKAAT